ncbi:MAG: SDR family oxidoreductase [Saprospiraceae bacterium]
MSNLPLSGRHALIGGASRGIGRATALALAEAGAHCTLLGRTAETLSTVMGELATQDGQQHEILVADQLELSDLATKVKAVANARPIHIWINNTGGPKGGPLHKAGVSELEAAFRQHIMAAQTILQEVLPSMQAAAYGRIINVISTSVKQPIPGLGVSNTIRAAMGTWAKTLAGELGAGGITVNNVLPGFTNTGRLNEIIESRAGAQGKTNEQIADGMKAGVPAGRFAEPSETATAIAFLASPGASYINGVNLPVDGGRTKSL